MRHRYVVPVFAAALLAATCAHAQQPWQPFRPGLTYQLTETGTPGDTTHALRVGAGTRVASTTDTLFQFSSRVSRSSIIAGSGQCYGRQARQPDNLFGASLRVQAGAVFVLAAANGRTLLLRPRAALGTSWATGRPGLTATVTSRAVATVLGTAPDSVATIQLSDGEVLRLSRRYGWLSGPSLDSYLNGRYVRRHLTLAALPERHLGTAVLGALAVFDYQPGDVFQRTTRSYVYVNALCQQTWWQDSVLTRQASRTGDTVTYTLGTRRRTQTFGTAGAPIGFCGLAAGTVVAAPITSSLVVVGSKGGDGGSQQLTSFFSGTTSFGMLTSPVSHTSAHFGGRPEFSQQMRLACTSAPADSVALGPPVDFNDMARYADGLGLTYRLSNIYTSTDITELTAFRKGSQSWGTFFPKNYLLAGRLTQTAATTSAFPNPFGAGLTVRFTLAGAQAVGFTLVDALGRTMQQAAPVALLAGAQELVLPTASLAPGLYTLVLAFGADGHREMLRVAKAE